MKKSTGKENERAADISLGQKLSRTMTGMDFCTEEEPALVRGNLPDSYQENLLET